MTCGLWFGMQEWGKCCQDAEQQLQSESYNLLAYWEFRKDQILPERLGYHLQIKNKVDSGSIAVPPPSRFLMPTSH